MGHRRAGTLLKLGDQARATLRIASESVITTTATARFLEQLVHAREQILAAERLPQDGRGVAGARGIDRVDAAAHHNDADVARSRVKLQQGRHVPTRDAWQHEIEEDELRAMADGLLKRLMAGARFDRGITSRTAGERTSLAQFGTVIDDEEQRQCCRGVRGHVA